MDYSIYTDIAKRTGGDIYLGIVGPVRTGKSTFIKRFMETLVIDKIEDVNKRARAIDELPQSADGKTIMTTEPKFVPNDAVKLNINNTTANIRMIDCVGYIVEGALGHTENEKPRMVNTPWSADEMPFQQAAEIGTNKVMREHSTIGIMITTDGTITDIPRAKYVGAEERVIKELKSVDKPFVIVLNSKAPNKAETVKLAESLSERYETPVIALNVAEATADDFGEILVKILMEFPICGIDVNLPKWMRALSREHEIIKDIINRLLADGRSYKKMRDYEKLYEILASSEVLDDNPDLEVDSATGIIRVSYKAREGVFYKVLANECKTDIDDDYKLMSYVIKATKAYNEYEKIKIALDEVNANGYGIVLPTMEDMELKEPELIKRGNQFGIKLKASAPSIHLIRVDVETEVNPTIGSEQQSEEVAKSLLESYKNDANTLWGTNMFGKTLSSIVREDISAKISSMPVDAQKKIRKTMTRIINESRGGVLCILI